MFLLSASIFMFIIIISSHSSSISERTQFVNIQLEHDRISFHLYLSNAKKRGNNNITDIRIVSATHIIISLMSHSTRRIILFILSFSGISHYICLHPPIIPTYRPNIVRPFDDSEMASLYFIRTKIYSGWHITKTFSHREEEYMRKSQTGLWTHSLASRIQQQQLF